MAAPLGLGVDGLCICWGLGTAWQHLWVWRQVECGWQPVYKLPLGSAASSWVVVSFLATVPFSCAIWVSSCSWWGIMLPPELPSHWVQQNGWNFPQIITFAVLTQSLRTGCFTNVFFCFFAELLYGHWVEVSSNSDCLKRWLEWKGGCHMGWFFFSVMSKWGSECQHIQKFVLSKHSSSSFNWSPSSWLWKSCEEGFP